MKKTFVLYCTILLGAFLFLSFSLDKNGTAEIHDGETRWSNVAYSFARGETSDEDLALWSVFFYTEIGNSLRTISLTMNTAEPGTYYGVYDESSGVWSNNAIGYTRLTVDYDGQPYPVWYGSKATVTIYEYNKTTKGMTAKLEAEVVLEGTTNTRTIKVEMDNLKLVE